MNYDPHYTAIMPVVGNMPNTFSGNIWRIDLSTDVLKYHLYQVNPIL